MLPSIHPLKQDLGFEKVENTLGDIFYAPFWSPTEGGVVKILFNSIVMNQI